MANIILIKRGNAANINSVELNEGELALAFNNDKSGAALYAGNGEGKVLLNPDISSEISQALTDANSYTDTKIDNLINGAPEAMDTLKELADAIAANKSVADAVNAAIGNKVDKISGKGLSTNDYTTEEKTKLAGIAENANNYSHPASHSADMITTTASKQFVSSTEKSTWNAKLGSSSTIDGGTF